MEEVQGNHLNVVSGLMTFSFALFPLPISMLCESIVRHYLMHISQLEISGNTYFVYVQTLANFGRNTTSYLQSSGRHARNIFKKMQTFTQCYCTDENYHYNGVCYGCVSMCKKLELGNRLDKTSADKTAKAALTAKCNLDFQSAAVYVPLQCLMLL